jgi:flagellar biosynthetic protein FliP
MKRWSWTFTAALLLISGIAYGQTRVPLPRITVGVGTAENPQQLSTAIQILFLITALSLAPAFLVMMTSFTRIIVVLSFLRHGLATQQLPSNQILAGLALFLTVFVMMPVWKDINEAALRPYLDGKIDQGQALRNAITPIREFMFRQTRAKDLALMVRLSGSSKPKNEDDVPTYVLIPAFVISELKTAFQIGFLLFVPFLAIDMVVASILMGMGMMMVPPVMISLPFKVLLFVLVDGWNLVVGSLVGSFH